MSEMVVLGYRCIGGSEAHRLLSDADSAIGRCQSNWCTVDSMREELATAGRHGRELLEQAIHDRRRDVLMLALGAGRVVERATKADGYLGVT